MRGEPLSLPPGSPVRLGDILAAGTGNAGIHYAGVDRTQSYAELLQEALCIAAGLSAQGVRAGDPVILQLDDAQDIIPLIWACFLGGAMAVPVAPVAAFATNDAQSRRLQAVCRMLGDPLVVADPARGDALPGSRLVSPETLRSAKPGQPACPDPAAPALLLLTSGSTGLPKGVPLTHANVLAMVAGTAQMNGFSAADTTLNWMPLDHAGSIIFLGVLPAWLGATQVHIPTRRVVERPLLWLELLARHRAAISWAPNFAFSLLTGAAAEVRQMAPDLSGLRFLVNAGEQVTPGTAMDFLAMLAPYGVPQNVLRPAFGMSETCSGITWSTGLTPAELGTGNAYVSLGGPIPGAELRITGEDGAVLQEEEFGRLELRGASVTAGYYANPAATAEAFSADGWFQTGDLGFLRDGELYLTGREKEELIISGRKVALHAVEASVETVVGVLTACTCAIVARQAETDGLVVAFCPAATDEAAWPGLLRSIRAHLARDMGLVPIHVVPLAPAELPRSSIGKIQRRMLQATLAAGAFAERITRFDVAPRVAGAEPLSAVERRVAAIWCAALDLKRVGRDENFFDLGGHSLLLIKVQSMLEAAFGPVALASLFMHTTVAQQARFLAGEEEATQTRQTARAGTDIAVIGMACRFPGADSVDAFWRNLRDGVESIRAFTPGDAVRDGVDPRAAHHPAYVAASPVLNDAAGFDAGFFGFTDAEAELMDPQHRHFLECCWEAMEDAGQDTLSAPGTVGVYAGASMNTYLLNNVLPARAGLDKQDDLRSLTLDSMGGFQLMVANDKDYLASRVSYKLNLRGPSLNLQTACSTGLVVIHQAVQSLLAGECDMAVAGTASVQAPQLAGHLYQDGMIVAPDGHCRAFDADARGTIFGSGVGAVVLKRLADALADGDRVLAVVKGTAVNNDGSRKVGYMAPSEAGESDVVRAALAAAGVPADSIGFVEAHGTGTEIGDPIEVSSLTRAYRQETGRSGFCALGSVKTNIGHAQISSGIAGFIKAVLALQHRQIPPTLHYRRPNPAIAFERTPFFVNAALLDWAEGASPRRAGVNSLGIGGTNAHVILEEAPPLPVREAQARPGWWLLPLSARSPEALAALSGRYQARVVGEPSLDLADLCYSAAVGRHHFAHRAAIVFTDRDALLAGLGSPLPSVEYGGDIAFLFTGQGSQYAGMALQLREEDPVFRAALQASGGPDLLATLDGAALDETASAQPALFAVGYALAQAWQARGVHPAALLGHSLGEYVAACVAGVFSLEDGLRLVTARGRLMQALPRDGAMLAVMCEAGRVEAALTLYRESVAIAALNGPTNTVISGAVADLAALAAQFEGDGVQTVALRTSHAFHSPRMRPMLEAFRAVLATVPLSPPSLTLISNLTGSAETTLFAEPDYWLRHVMEPVRFAEGFDAVRALGCTDFVEIGPKPVLAGLVRAAGGTPVLASLRPGVPDGQQMLESLGALYRRGLSVDWRALHDAGARRRVALPTYPFQHRRYWIEPRPLPALAPALHPLVHRRLRLPGLPQTVFETELDTHRLPLLAQHRVQGRLMVAGAGHLSMLLAAAALMTRRAAHTLRKIAFTEPLLLPDSGARQVQMQFMPMDGGHEARLVSLDADEHSLHATAFLAAEVGASPAIDIAAARARCEHVLNGAALYARLTARHIVLGPQFRWLDRLWLGEGEAVFEINPPAGEAIDPALPLHPGLLDSLLQPALAVLAMGAGDATYVPVAMESFRILAQPAAFPLMGHVRRRGAARDVADTVVVDASGACVAEIDGFEFRRLGAERIDAALDSSLYEIAWEECPPVPEMAGFPPPVALMRDTGLVRNGLAEMLAMVNSPRSLQQTEDLEALGLAYLGEALEQAGALPAPGAWLDTAEIGRRLGLAPTREPLLRRLLHILARHGRLFRRDRGWEGLDCPPTMRAAAQRTRIEGRYGAEAAAELALLGACGMRLGAILRGEADPLDALFPGGDLAPATRLYQDSAGFGALNTLLANLVEGLARSLAPGRRLRILEVGAGTGASSHHVLRRLDPARVDYVFTDVSPLFLARAREKFAAWPGMDYRLLDIERDPATQGIEPHSVDIVIAANVLHATRDLAETLGNVRRMLRPGGQLALLEVNEPTVPVDLTFGLLDGWWRFADLALRPDYPLLSRRQWLALLRTHGFAEAEAAPLDIPTPGGRQSVILAQADAMPVGVWAVLGGAQDALAAALANAGAAAQPMTERALDAALAEGTKLRGIVLLATPGAGATSLCNAAVRLVQAQLAAGTAVPMHLVTSGAATDPAQAALPGLGRVLFQEHPHLAGSLLDADRADAIAAILLQGRPEDELALRDGRVLGPRLRQTTPPPPAATVLSGEGSYLITGGFGGIGLRLAAALAARGARHLLLLGRHAPDRAARAAIDAIAADIRIVEADVADEAALGAALAEQEPPLKGVFHLAGVLHQGPLAQLSPSAFTAATAAKIDGALNLDRLTRGMPIEHFVLFSSAAALLGLPGQGAYAAANAALDALARRRRAAGLPAVSIGWGRWAEVGMVAADSARLEAAGHRAITPDVGLDLMTRLLDGPAYQAVLPADWPRLLAGLPHRASLLDGLGLPAPTPPVASLPAFSEGIVPFLMTELQRITGAPAAPPLRSTLLELGLDSLTSINLRNSIARTLGVTLPLNMLMDATVQELAEELEERHALAGRIRLDGAPAAETDALVEEDILL